MKSLIDTDPTITLKELQKKVHDELNIDISTSALSTYIDEFGYSFKRVNTYPLRTLNPATLEERRAYSLWFMDAMVEGKSVLFTDETGFQVSTYQVARHDTVRFRTKMCFL